MSRFLTARKDDFLTQDLINTLPSQISLCQFSDSDAVKAPCLVEELAPMTLGVSLQLSEDASIDAIALATVNCVYLITVTCSDASPNASLQRLLQHESYPLAGFGMEQLALLLYRHGSDCRGIDLGTALASDGRGSWSPSMSVYKLLDDEVDRHRINEVWYRTNRENTCLRAWFSANLAARGSNIEHALKVDTRRLNEEQLDVLGRLLVNVILLTAQKPLEMENEHERLVKNEYGQLELQSARFKTRVRRSEETSIVIRDKSGRTIYGRATNASGKTTHIEISRGTYRGEVESIHVVGREEPTNAERARDEFILRLLRGQVYLDSRFIDVFWFPGPSIMADVRLANTSASNSHLEHVQLNESQRTVTNAMVLGSQSVIITHGPPGTGKTKTISTAVEFWDQRGSPVWVIAQSNVGVKNIAESFFKHDINFKLLVSKEFHFEWHEYLYERFQEVLIRSDDLSGNKDPGAAERLFGGCSVVLCTLSMLSNPVLEDRLIFKLIPMEKLIADEASQIDVFEFMHLFHKFKELRKICFFGDPKQLPPFGKEAAPGLQTVFDLKHLRQHAYFLDTQYRMPVPLGDFISQQFYSSKLRSAHSIQEMSCVAFVDVRRGEEEQKGRSWVNMEEVHVVANLVRHYYRNLDFCIITPYDSQRSAIAKQLQAEELPWQCVYNVDSFQGTLTVVLARLIC
ncbi:P-loop containing nucleoside triphosphate hydrolase protein [Laetiporus sulphureus 93-53]|uniref:p-loop containing nucleoside triphosphate hydrolase protein n=1 Tax=Laetiporus sulphureus 93-53 TaxID=1314785 RepID=A0A165DG93_9APHY|nr:P-loop containing nucleoside triphosphate hydrolase protein [Laetiporus sulphureus 93-53]KZT04827.1 P-loop containing nucleoside triphosphate hydrolase protein [Laetiporus sulphureus 93-53]